MTKSTIQSASETRPSPAARTQAGSEQTRKAKGLFALVIQHMPTLAVIASLAGVGAYGHYSHWKVPKYSVLTGGAPPVADDWCEEHGVRESNCVECNLDRFPNGPDYGWCREHGVQNCVLHHPEVAQLRSRAKIT